MVTLSLSRPLLPGETVPPISVSVSLPGVEVAPAGAADGAGCDVGGGERCVFGVDGVLPLFARRAAGSGSSGDVVLHSGGLPFLTVRLE